MENPWKTLSSRPIYDNHWIEVRENQVIRPDGNHGIYGVVHFKNRAVAVLPIDDDENVYLVGQYRYTTQKYSWEVPEGGCPDGEEPLDAAKRELLEETGFSANRWTFLGKTYLSNSVTDEVGYLFMARELTPGRPQPEGTEVLEYRRVALEEAVRMVMSGEIDDALSVICILRYCAARNSTGTVDG